MKFELLVATRYLKAKRKQAVISLITVISIIGVAAGVAALIIALAINAGFTEDLQHKLLGAQAHITLRKDVGGIDNYVEVAKQIEQIPGVVAAAPSVYDTVLISSSRIRKGVIMKGVIPDLESRISALSSNIVKGSLKDFGQDSIIIGEELSQYLGAFVGDSVQIISATPMLTPMGSMPRPLTFKVVAIFSSGLYDLDSTWVYVPISDAQRLLRTGDLAGSIEVKVNDIYQARVIGKKIVDKLGGGMLFEDWMELNQSIFHALRLEKVVMFITIGLIVIVAALNIVATLIMMVLEKTRDIAILMSMGATQENIRRVFILQGVVIGIVGTAIGVVLGHTRSFFADKYHLVSLAPDVYTIAYVPFRPELTDTLVVSAAAVLIRFSASVYP